MIDSMLGLDKAKVLWRQLIPLSRLLVSLFSQGNLTYPMKEQSVHDRYSLRGGFLEWCLHSLPHMEMFPRWSSIFMGMTCQEDGTTKPHTHRKGGDTKCVTAHCDRAQRKSIKPQWDLYYWGDVPRSAPRLHTVLHAATIQYNWLFHTHK